MNRGVQIKGCIINIERFAVHDGPGIRDLVFLKGCPLSCQWCSNPESQKVHPEIMFNDDRCIQGDECNLCEQACHSGAIGISPEGRVELCRTRCNDCGACAVACPAKAIRMIGEYYTSDQVVKVVLEDCSFYTRSGGGMTLSGGEPLLQPEFVGDLLEMCHQNGIDTAIETCGHVPWENLKRVHEMLSTIYYDIKVMNPKIHKKYTGVDNELILQNIIKLSSVCSKPKIIVRTPVLPGINDSEDNIRATAEFINGLSGVRAYELLPYHRFGESKYQHLGRNYGLMGVEKPSKEHMENLRGLVNF